MRNFVIGLLVIGGGTLMIVYHQQLYELFGPIGRFERNMGDSRAAYVLFGAAVIVLGVLLMFGIGAESPVEGTQELQLG